MSVTYTLADASTTLSLQIANDSTYGSSNIQTLKIGKEAITAEVPIPTQDADKTIIVDAMGCKKTYTITIITTGTITQLDNFYDVLDGFLDSNQMFTSGSSLSGLAFTTGTDSFPISLTNRRVIMRSLDCEYTAGEVQKLESTMILVEGNN